MRFPEKNMVGNLNMSLLPASRFVFPLLIVLLIVFLILVKMYQIGLTMQLQTGSELEQPLNFGELVRLKVSQDDSRVLEYIRTEKLILEPYNGTKPYNLKNDAKHDPSMGQSKAVMKILNNLEAGFFVECGALDGETRSNTLFLERFRGWKGLLIEAGQRNFDIILEKRRRSWLSQTCLATVPNPQLVLFRQGFNVGRIAYAEFVPEEQEELLLGRSRNNGDSDLVPVRCFPLFSLLASIGVTTVDYFSLDVEGSEFEVLESIPWEKVQIRVISVEITHDIISAEGIAKFMLTKGYKVATRVVNNAGFANDLIFVHESGLNLYVSERTDWELEVRDWNIQNNSLFARNFPKHQYS